MPMHARRVDWFRVLDDLARVGCSPYKISALFRISRDRVRGWKDRGHEPRYLDGFYLVALWCALCDRKIAELPILATGVMVGADAPSQQIDWVAEFDRLKVRNRGDSPQPGEPESRRSSPPAGALP